MFNRNKRGQEVHPGAVIMGCIGGIVGFILAGRMETGVVGSIFIGLVTLVVCYFLVARIAD